MSALHVSSFHVIALCKSTLLYTFSNKQPDKNTDHYTVVDRKVHLPRSTAAIVSRAQHRPFTCKHNDEIDGTVRRRRRCICIEQRITGAEGSAAVVGRSAGRAQLGLRGGLPLTGCDTVHG